MGQLCLYKVVFNLYFCVFLPFQDSLLWQENYSQAENFDVCPSTWHTGLSLHSYIYLQTTNCAVNASGYKVVLLDLCVHTNLSEDGRDDCGQTGRFTQLILTLQMKMRRNRWRARWAFILQFWTAKSWNVFIWEIRLLVVPLTSLKPNS